MQWLLFISALEDIFSFPHCQAWCWRFGEDDCSPTARSAQPVSPPLLVPIPLSARVLHPAAWAESRKNRENHEEARGKRMTSEIVEMIRLLPIILTGLMQGPSSAGWGPSSVTAAAADAWITVSGCLL